MEVVFGFAVVTAGFFAGVGVGFPSALEDCALLAGFCVEEGAVFLGPSFGGFLLGGSDMAVTGVGDDGTTIRCLFLEVFLEVLPWGTSRLTTSLARHSRRQIREAGEPFPFLASTLLKPIIHASHQGHSSLAND